MWSNHHIVTKAQYLSLLCLRALATKMHEQGFSVKKIISLLGLASLEIGRLTISETPLPVSMQVTDYIGQNCKILWVRGLGSY